MRKQYHFRPSKNGSYAWDVDRLIEDSKGLPVLEVPLHDIPTEEDFGPVRGCPAFAEHMKLVDQTSLEYPVILSPDNRVMDGLHRVIKAYLKGDRTIKAVRFDTLPPPDFTDVHENDLPYGED